MRLPSRQLWLRLLLSLVVAPPTVALRVATRPEPLGIGAAEPAELPGLQNVFRVSDKLYSGSAPEGEAGFCSLRGLGIRTVISVDGLRPEVALARRHDMRYVHLPFGYDGCPIPRALEIIRAVRDLPGPVYLHCHHGKHRGPAAAALVHIALDGASNAQALAFMRRAGTDSRYTGLYGAAASFRRPTQAQVDHAPDRFPAVVPVPPLADAMVRIDARFEALRRFRREDWHTPRDHPDVVPAHEALQLEELFHELQRTGALAARPPDFWARMRTAEDEVAETEAALRARDDRRAKAAFDRAAAACESCHALYRNVPQTRQPSPDRNGS